ncbi:MAG TPA: ABC transporter permease [Thermomonospora sp.]|nr:ABC transporter permease [Thermomonospora sp.]
MTALTISVDRPAAPALHTLTVVELRKMVNTRAGRWLLVFVALCGVALVGVVLFAAPRADRTMPEMYSASLSGVAILLPVLGVLSVTGEWSQRTALTTFTLVPGRERVIAAKLLAGAVLATLCLAVSAVAAWTGRALGAVLDRTDAGWGVPPSMLASTLLLAVLGVWSGVAFGMLFLNTPLAIVLFFLLPIAWSVLGETVNALDGAANWLDTARTTAPLGDPEGEMTGRAWARLAVSQAVWLLLPAALGTMRVLRQEVK